MTARFHLCTVQPARSRQQQCKQLLDSRDQTRPGRLNTRLKRCDALLCPLGNLPHSEKSGWGLFDLLNRTVPAVLKDGRRELIITAAGFETGPLKKPVRSFCVTTPAAVCHTRVRVRGFWLVAGEPRDTKSAEPRPKETSFQAWLTRKGWLWQPT